MDKCIYRRSGCIFLLPSKRKINIGWISRLVEKNTEKARSIQEIDCTILPRLGIEAAQSETLAQWELKYYIIASTILGTQCGLNGAHKKAGRRKVIEKQELKTHCACSGTCLCCNLQCEAQMPHRCCSQLTVIPQEGASEDVPCLVPQS